MIKFYPQQVPFIKAVKLLFTRKVWVAVYHNQMGIPTAVRAEYDKPQGAIPMTDEEAARMVEEQQAAREEAITQNINDWAKNTQAQEEAEDPQPVEAAVEPQPPLFSTRYQPPKLNRRERRAAQKGRK